MTSSALERLWRADSHRKTRFHTQKDQLVLTPDLLSSLVTTLARHGFDRYAALPWLTYPAIRFLDDRLTGRRMLEFGCGTSTLWYAKRCAEVISLENNEDWFAKVARTVEAVPNVSLRLMSSDLDFLTAAEGDGGSFSAVVIDCQPVGASHAFADTDTLRTACLEAAVRHATTDCIFVIDNTDAFPALDAAISRLFRNRNILRFPGWTPGNLHPCETTIVI